MCFTIEIHLTRKAIENRFSVDTSALNDFDFNYFYRAFSNPGIPVITQNRPSEIQLLQWGLIPAWATDLEKAKHIRKGTYNARSETLHETPSFRNTLHGGRCLVIAHGFFEWQLRGGAKIPWYIRLKDDAPFAFAGLFDTWLDPGTGDSLNSFSIITTKANPLMGKIHNTKKRMPVILSPELEKEWISGDISLRKMKQLLVPLNEKMLLANTVSPLLSGINANPKDPAVIQPYEFPVSGTLF